MSDDDFDLDGALEQSLAQMEANENDNVNNNNSHNPDEEDNDDGNNNSNNNNSTTNNADDDVIMQEALNAVQQSINNANDAQSNTDMMDDNEMKDFFNEIFNSFSNLDDNADDESLDKALKKVMTQFFDAEQLKEPVKIICSKYPGWLEQNRSKIPAKDYENYVSQYELYKKANDLLNSNKPDTSQIMDILLKTFSYGSLPADVMDGMMPDELKQFADQMSQFEKNIDKNDDSNTNNNSSDNNNNENENNENNGGNKDDDMNAEEAMKFFQQLMGMQNGGNNNNNNNDNDEKDNDFMPKLDDLPKLSEAEKEQFKQLMNQDGCSIM